MVPFLSLKKQGLNFPWCPRDFVVELQEAKPAQITTAASANLSLFIAVKFKLEKVFYKKDSQKMRAFFVNLQGNFETNTQLGLRNQL